MKNLNENQKIRVYENMGIYELRNYARGIGVKSSTNKAKSELIDLILKIENGEIPPHNNFRGGKGRPPKAIYPVKINLNERQLEEECKKLRGMIKRISNIIKEYE